MNEKELRYLFKEIIQEMLNEHYYDMRRALAWYTGWWYNGLDVVKMDRTDGIFFPWRNKPYIEMTRGEFCELMGIEVVLD